VVLTLHNFRLMCLPATFLRNGRICEDCLGRKPWPGVIHGCYRGSPLASVPYFASISLHQALGTFEGVTRFVAVSEFVRDKHVEGGFPAERIVVKPNFAWPAPRREGPGEYFLFSGRLVPEKGLHVLLRAWRPSLGKLVVVGDGPLSTLLSPAPTGVEFRGAIPSARVTQVVRRARALIVPSTWYEAFPRSVVEAYAQGVPVVASRLGALSEAVQNDVSGLLTEPGDPRSLLAAMERLLGDDESERLGEGAYRLWAERHTPEQNLVQLEAIYAEAMDAARPSGAGPNRE
jgi:glycosyltransferase involved in cell wall biosynthesis